jgi:hypothetical protein
MHVVAYGAALVLAAVFVRAAVAKLADRQATATAFGELGLPAVAATAVPLVELALAGALVVVPAWGGVFALALLAGFTAFLILAIRSGARTGCNCFGSARRGPVSWNDVLRNCVLVVLAVVALTA